MELNSPGLSGITHIECGLLRLLGTKRMLNTSKRLLLCWILIGSSIGSLGIGFKGAWICAPLLIASAYCRSSLPYIVASRMQRRLVYPLAVSAAMLVCIPALMVPPDAFVGIFRTFQWLGVGFVAAGNLVVDAFAHWNPTRTNDSQPIASPEPPPRVSDSEGHD